MEITDNNGNLKTVVKVIEEGEYVKKDSQSRW